MTEALADKSPSRESDGAQAEQRSDGDLPTHGDRLGDLSMSLTKAALNNPAIAITISTIILFVIARIPAEVFYSSLGLRPEDAGLSSVQILLQGVTTVLVVSLGIGLLYGVVMQFVNAVYFRFVRRLGRKMTGPLRPPDNPAERFVLQVVTLLFGAEAEQSRPLWRMVLRRSPLVVAVFGLVVASLILTLSAINDADAIKNGKAPPGGPVPWRARRVAVRWTHGSPQILLPGCHALYYLGEGGGRVALFDSKTGSTYRLLAESVQLSFPAHCEGG